MAVALDTVARQSREEFRLVMENYSSGSTLAKEVVCLPGGGESVNDTELLPTVDE
ncbi:MAG: hypothetical protein ACK5Z0_04855 [Planctomycetota bacterium]